ncbi:hypothetical protein K439DRAFT_1664839 [Ramaria rubella]|nr:hypothetical protein K439DRAFT_1664839 [Ramaria rubella]
MVQQQDSQECHWFPFDDNNRRSHPGARYGHHSQVTLSMSALQVSLPIFNITNGLHSCWCVWLSMIPLYRCAAEGNSVELSLLNDRDDPHCGSSIFWLHPHAVPPNLGLMAGPTSRLGSAASITQELCCWGMTENSRTWTITERLLGLSQLLKTTHKSLLSLQMFDICIAGILADLLYCR